MWIRNFLKNTIAAKKKPKNGTKRPKPRINRKALKRSLWGSLSRVIGVGLGAGAGGLLHQLVGDGLGSWTFAIGLAAASFACMWFAEYERETEV